VNSLDELLSLYHEMTDEEQQELLDFAREICGDPEAGENFRTED